jgi:hypothetical protein
MIRTIKVGEYISIQGLFVAARADGAITVRVGSQEYTGHPV